MKDPIKVAMGKKSKAKGMRFESKVRKDLESKGWIVDKWTNNVEFEPCKEGCNGCGKELCISCNVPKYSKHKENCSQTIRSGMWYFCKGECQSCSNHSHHDQSQQEEPSDDGCKPVDSDFILSEMRNKLRVMKFYNAKGELITDKIMDEINFQDKEFILKLKEGQPLGAKFYVIDKERFDKLSGKFK